MIKRALPKGKALFSRGDSFIIDQGKPPPYGKMQKSDSWLSLWESQEISQKLKSCIVGADAFIGPQMLDVVPGPLANTVRPGG